MKQDLIQSIISCQACPRLVEHRRSIARTRRRAYRDETYWGRPVPPFGDPAARLLIVGLAPGAHGANRTGRLFTGDSSGDFLYPTLHRFGFSSRPESRSMDDGLELRDAYITNVVRCVPPANRPTRDEITSCAAYLREELAGLEHVRVILALGAIAWNALFPHFPALGNSIPRPRPRFGHLSEFPIRKDLLLVGSYHPSQQNTRTGRLTQEMFDAAFRRCRKFIDGGRCNRSRGQSS